jgi:glycosyltransferase involved in cell wall biosynthesis
MDQRKHYKVNEIMKNSIEGISIVTIVKNGVEFIEETILSVVSQQNITIEYIIIDGGSTDGTLDIIKLYEDQITHFVSGLDGGIYHAINKGISLSSYPLVGLIHCGDCYAPDVLAHVYDTFKITGASILYGDVVIKEAEGGNVYLKNYIADHRYLRKKMSIFHPSTFISRKSYLDSGLYDVSFRSAADYDLLLRRLIDGDVFFHIPFVLAIFRGGGVSSTNFKLSIRENFRIRQNQLGFKSAISYIVKTVLFHCYFSFRKKVFIFIFGQSKYIVLKKNKYKKIKTHSI